jgi:uncharacterized protein (TIGR02118 family)
MVRVVGVYLGASGNRFDAHYYKSGHVPLAHSLLDAYGLQSVRLLSEFEPPADGGLGLIMISEMLFASREGFEAGLAAGGEALFADLKNFTDIAPLLQLCETIDENA